MRLLAQWCNSVRHIGSVPNLPRPSSVRESLANLLFIALRFLATFGFIIGGAIGMVRLGTPGLVVGVIMGAAVGWWIRYSMALRKGSPTHGFFVRMQERALSSKPKLLESIIELVRGTSLTITKSRMLASAYEGLHHHLQTCDSSIERKRLVREFNHAVFAAIYGNRPFPATQAEDEIDLLETQNANVDA